MRRAWWVWVIVAFIVGLVPGTGLYLLERGTYIAARAQLLSRNAQLNSQVQSVTVELHSAEASLSALAAQLPVQSPGPAASSAGTSTSGGTPKGVPVITERTVSPDPVARGGKIVLTVKLNGHADKVNLRIATASSSFDKTYFLAKTGSTSTGETWGSTISAPPTAGTYRFYAIAYAGSTKYPMPGIQTFTVK